MTNSFKKIILIIVTTFISLLFIQSCAEDPEPSLYDLPGGGGATPVISSVNPPNEALAGVTEITITGNNFSADPEENLVFFNGELADVKSATITQLVLTAPNVVSDSIAIKIAVNGAEQFSNNFIYKLSPAVSEIVNPDGEPIYNVTATAANQFTNIYGITVDNQENLLISVAGGGSEGIKKVTPAGDVTDYAPKGAESFFAYMKIGLGDTIYAARASSRGIWQVVQGITSITWITQPQGTIIADLDFDINLNIWTVGSAIFRVTRNKEVKSFPFVGTLRSVRVFGNSLFVAGKKDDIEGVWKFQIISSDSLSSPELYFDLSQYTNEASAVINTITFSADGDLIVGTTKEVDPIVIIHPDKSIEPLYPGVIPLRTDVVNFAWGTGEFLYFNRPGVVDGEAIIHKPGLMKLNMQEAGAPYYGRD